MKSLKNKLGLTRKFLYKEYVVNKKSCQQIASRVGCSISTIWRDLKIDSISLRTTSEANRCKIPKYSKILTKKFLYREYIINKKSTLQIAKIAKCCVTTIADDLRKYDIDMRTIGEANELKWSKILTKKFLHQEYITKKKSMTKIAKEVGCDTGAVWRKFIKYNIFCRTKREIGKMSNVSGKNNPMYGKLGKLNPNYIEGLIREYPVEFNSILKESIRTRDNHVCQICGKTTKKNGRKLDVHHIDYIKENLDSLNLISLCRQCHQKTNYNREIYLEYFKILKGILQ